MPITKLNKWGNSQGVLISKDLCERMGFQVGDHVEMSINPKTHRIELFAATGVLSSSTKH